MQCSKIAFGFCNNTTSCCIIFTVIAILQEPSYSKAIPSLFLRNIKIKGVTVTEAKITRLVRDIRIQRGEEETILGNNPEAYLRDLRKDPERIRRLLREAGIYDENGKLTQRYR